MYILGLKYELAIKGVQLQWNKHATDLPALLEKYSMTSYM